MAGVGGDDRVLLKIFVELGGAKHKAKIGERIETKPGKFKRMKNRKLIRMTGRKKKTRQFEEMIDLQTKYHKKTS